MAPEMYEEHYDEAVDVYAFGMLASLLSATCSLTTWITSSVVTPATSLRVESRFDDFLRLTCDTILK